MSEASRELPSLCLQTQLSSQFARVLGGRPSWFAREKVNIRADRGV